MGYLHFGECTEVRMLVALQAMILAPTWKGLKICLCSELSTRVQTERWKSGLTSLSATSRPCSEWIFTLLVLFQEQVLFPFLCDADPLQQNPSLQLPFNFQNNLTQRAGSESSFLWVFMRMLWKLGLHFWPHLISKHLACTLLLGDVSFPPNMTLINTFGRLLTLCNSKH